jgi:hypothetical protein
MIETESKTSADWTEEELIALCEKYHIFYGYPDSEQIAVLSEKRNKKR